MLLDRIGLVVLLLMVPASAAAQFLAPEFSTAGGQALDLPPGFVVDLVTAHQFQQPIAVALAPDERTFVAERRGLIHVIDNGISLAQPFLDLEDEVLLDGDRGMLGIALDPDFSSNGFVYLYYVVDFEDTSDSHRLDAFARLVRYREDPKNPNTADVSSRHVLIGNTFATGIPACHFSHNGGKIAFGSDGSLLLSTGDAASYDGVDAGGLYPECFNYDAGKLNPSEDIGAFRSLRIESLAGKILRIDPNTGLGYPSNPFYTGTRADNASRIWAYGLRNPFRFAVRPGGSTDPSDGQPGLLLLSDVGWVGWEELQPVYGGENFGWPCREGPSIRDEYEAATPATNGCDTMGPTVLPHFYWSHSSASDSHPPGLIAFALVAGDIYKGQEFPTGYRNSVFYMDYVTQWMAYAQLSEEGELSNHTLFGEGVGRLSELVYDSATQSFVMVDNASGLISRLSYDESTPTEPGPSQYPDEVSIVHVHPNPAANWLVVEVNAGRPMPTTISVFDVLGRQVFGEGKIFAAGRQTLQLDVRGFTDGVYHIVVNGQAGQNASTTFTVVD